MWQSGAVAATSVVARPLAQSTSSEPFALRLHKSRLADSSLRKSLLSKKTRSSILQDLQQFKRSDLVVPDVGITLTEFAERIQPIPLEDISPSFKTMDCPMYDDFSFATLLYSDPWHPDPTVWLPRKPNQIEPPGPSPRCVQDLYEAHQVESVWQKREAAFEASNADMGRYWALGSDAPRRHKTYLASGDQVRKPRFRGKIYDNRDPEKFCLLQFDTPVDHLLSYSFVASLFHRRARAVARAEF